MRERLRRWWWVIGLAIAAIVVIALAPLASPDPDGLESVAGQHGFLETAQAALYQLLPGYSIPGLDDPTLSTIVSGLIGVLVVFLVVVGLGWVLRRRRSSAS